MSFPPHPEMTRLRHQRDDLERALDQTVKAACQLLARIEHSAEPVSPPVWEALRGFFHAGMQAARGRSPQHAQQFERLAARSQARLHGLTETVTAPSVTQPEADHFLVMLGAIAIGCCDATSREDVREEEPNAVFTPQEPATCPVCGGSPL